MSKGEEIIMKREETSKLEKTREKTGRNGKEEEEEETAMRGTIRKEKSEKNEHIIAKI